MNNVDVQQIASHHDWSIWGLFWQADFIVQLVMLLLLGASFWCWTIVFSKNMRLRDVRKAADEFEESFWSGGSLDSLYDHLETHTSDPMATTFISAMKEWRRALKKGKKMTKDAQTTLQHRIERVMHVSVNKEMEGLQRHLGFLASVGSTAPFIGLFGTVWGIMNSFQGIAAAQSTSLAVVAPGIAEALFATALGLLAAIPAVLAYNKLSSDLNHYANRLEVFVSEFSALVSRQLDEKVSGHGTAA